MTTPAQAPASIRLDLSRRAITELGIVEGDTAGEGSSQEHFQLAEQINAATKLPNGKYRLIVTPDTLVYLAENLHYHIDRLQEAASSANPNYDWQAWSDAGATLSSFRGLDTRVKSMCTKLGLPYRVWSFTHGLHFPKAKAS